MTLLDLNTNALYRSYSWDFSVRAHRYLRYQLISSTMMDSIYNFNDVISIICSTSINMSCRHKQGFFWYFFNCMTSKPFLRTTITILHRRGRRRRSSPVAGGQTPRYWPWLTAYRLEKADAPTIRCLLKEKPGVKRLYRVLELWLPVIFNYVTCNCFLEIYKLSSIL